MLVVNYNRTNELYEDKDIHCQTKQVTALGFGSWSEAAVAARYRVMWRRRVSGPIPTKGLRFLPFPKVTYSVFVA